MIKNFMIKYTTILTLAFIYILIFIQYPLGVGITQLILHKNVLTSMAPGFLLLWGLVRICFVLPLTFFLMQRLSWDGNDIFMRFGDYRKVTAITFWSTFGFLIVGLGLYPWFLHESSLTPLLLLEYLPIFLIYAVSNAFVEETFFRGVLQNYFSKKMHYSVAIVLQALLFAAIHLYSPMSSNLTLFVVLTFFLGLAWGILTRKYRSLLPAIVLHVVADIFVAVSLF